MSRSRSRSVLLGGAFTVAVVTVAFALWVHAFLSPVKPIPADLLVIEGWVPDEVVEGAAELIRTGAYSHVLVSRMQSQGPPAANARRVFDRLHELGVEPTLLHDAPAPFSPRHRTASTARAVREKIIELGLNPRGINLVSGGPHSRQSWLAYERIMENVAPVGVIAIRKGHYDPDAWWMSRQGLSWVLKDFAGWLKEALIGPRA